MNELLTRVQSMGVVPVVVLNDAKDAAPLAKALCDGPQALTPPQFTDVVNSVNKVLEAVK